MRPACRRAARSRRSDRSRPRAPDRQRGICRLKFAAIGHRARTADDEEQRGDVFHGSRPFAANNDSRRTKVPALEPKARRNGFVRRTFTLVRCMSFGALRWSGVKAACGVTAIARPPSRRRRREARSPRGGAQDGPIVVQAAARRPGSRSSRRGRPAPACSYRQPSYQSPRSRAGARVGFAAYR